MDHNFYQFSVLYFHKSFVLSFCNASPNSHQSVNPDLVEQILGPIPMTLWEQEESPTWALGQPAFRPLL